MTAIGHLQSVLDVPPIPADGALAAQITLSEHFRVTATGLEVVGQPSFELCENLWTALHMLEKSIQFAIGDAVRYFEGRWGEKASQIVDATGLSLETVRVYAWVAEHVPAENRMIDRGLSYAHHQAVASLPHADQRKWLTKALGEDGESWPVARLKAALKAGGDVEPSGFWVMVECKDEADQTATQKMLELQGRNCRAITKR